MNKLLAKAPRPASHSETAGSVSAAPSRLSRIARIARVVVVPVVAVAALAGAAGSAHAATSSVGQIGASVYCYSDTYHHTAQIGVYPYARENSQFASQAVAYRYGYYTARGFVPSGWSGATWVNADYWTIGANGEPTEITGWASLPSASWSVAPGGGRIAAIYVQGDFWNGTAYEIGPWIEATYYTMVNGYSTGQGGSTVPCSV